MSARQGKADLARAIRRKRRRLDDAPSERAERSPAHAAVRAAGLSHATAHEAQQDALLSLQQTSGNQHVQRLLAREAEKEAAAAAPAAPQLRDSDLATLLVFPDDLALSLGLAQDPKREWPVPQRMADRLQPVVDALGGAALDLKGGAAFKLALLLDLEWLIGQPSGRELIDALARAGKRLTIEYAPSGGEPRALSEGDAMLRPDGTLGPGSDVQLRYAPEPWMPQDGEKAWEQRKPAEDMARALVAALPMLTGSAPTTHEREPVAAGAQATGDDPLQRAIDLENRLRAAFGLPIRPS